MDVTNRDGSISRVISIGVPADHPFADLEMNSGNSGLHNIRIGPIRLLAPPTFIVRIRPHGQELHPESESAEEYLHVREQAGIRPDQRVVHIDTHLNNEAEFGQITEQVDRITGAINSLITSFQSLFSGMQFLRMQASLEGVSPSEFMSNFN